MVARTTRACVPDCDGPALPMRALYRL